MTRLYPIELCCLDVQGWASCGPERGAVAMRISVTNNLTAEGVRWHVIEQGKILRRGTASTALQATAAAIKAVKQIEAERSSFHDGIPKKKENLRFAPAWLLT